MRDYAKIAPTFWTGETGRVLRGQGSDSQLIALYLLTGPHANMTGLYYLPIPTLSHETGRPLEGASKALRSLSGVGFAHYDKTAEVVWVPEMARYQIGPSLKAGDNRIKGIVRELEPYRKSRFYVDFADRYWEAFCLPGDKPLRSPSEGPSEPLRSQEQEQEQEKEQEQEEDLPASPGSAPRPDLQLSGDPTPKAKKRSEAEVFWERAQGQRLKRPGLIREAEPEQPALNVWFARAAKEIGSDRLWAAFGRYLRDDYWSPKGCPFAGFMTETVWRKHAQTPTTQARPKWNGAA